MNRTIFPTKLSGIISIPPSKSDTQRAMLCAALAKGKSVLYNVGFSNDERNMLRALESLGTHIKRVDEKRRIFEIDSANAFEKDTKIEIGESGLGVRLLIAVLSSFSNTFTINGEGSLVNRPMDFYTKNLSELSVQISSKDGKLPIQIKGPIQPKEITVDGSLSSQFISGLTMALVNTKKPVVFHVQDLKSVPYVQMTLDTLTQFGISVEANLDTPTKLKTVPSIDDIYKHIMGITEVDVHNQTDSTLTTFRIKANQVYTPTQYKIEGDWSSASYWIVAKMLGAEIEIEGLNLHSLQADKKLLEISNWKLENKFKFQMSNFEFNATDCPDLFPALTALAAFQKGTSVITGVHRLKHKESNRGEVLQKEFAKLGVKIDLLDDEMHVHGTGEVKGGKIDTHNDHRIAMCFGIVGLFATSHIEIQGAEAVNKSYPKFWKDLERLTDAYRT